MGCCNSGTWKNCNMEIEIVTFLVPGNYEVERPYRLTGANLSRKQKGCNIRRVVDLKLRGIHLTEIILKVWVINGQDVVDCIDMLEVNFLIVLKFS